MPPRSVGSPRPGSLPPPLPTQVAQRRRTSRVGERAADSTIPLNLDDLMLEVASEVAAEDAAGRPATPNQPELMASEPETSESSSRDEADDEPPGAPPGAPADHRGEHCAAG